MEQIIFVYRDIVVGGAELLIEKVANELIFRNIKVKVVCESISQDMQQRYEASNIDICIIKNWNNVGKLFMNSNEKTGVITFFLKDFISIYAKSHKNVKTICYAIHFSGLYYATSVIIPAFNTLVKKLIPIRKLVNSGNCICMDEHVIRCTKEYYDLKEKCSLNWKVVRIPIKPVEVGEEFLLHRLTNAEFNILTIARADFPFKGYLLGLIDMFADITDKNVTLTIVSYGKDVEKIENRISVLPDNIKKRISLIGKTDFDELAIYYRDSSLYMGMGTTIIDAAQYGVISIPVAAYTERLIADSFFHDNYKNLVVEETIPKNSVNELIDKALNLNKKEYLELSKINQNIARRYYTVGVTVDELLTIFDLIKYDKRNIYVTFLRCLERIKRIIR